MQNYYPSINSLWPKEYALVKQVLKTKTVTDPETLEKLKEFGFDIDG